MNKRRLTSILLLVSLLVPLAAYDFDETILGRFKLEKDADGQLVAFDRYGTMVQVEKSERDGRRYSFNHSFYELETYPDGRYLVPSLDKNRDGKKAGHSVYLINRQNRGSAIPGWVLDEKPILTGYPGFEDRLVLRYRIRGTSKIEPSTIITRALEDQALSGIVNPTDAQKKTAYDLARSIYGYLSVSSDEDTQSSYWMKVGSGSASEWQIMYGMQTVSKGAYAAALVGSGPLRTVQDLIRSGARVQPLMEALASVAGSVKVTHDGQPYRSGTTPPAAVSSSGSPATTSTGTTATTTTTTAASAAAGAAVTKANAVKGMRVVRGKDWKWENQDGGAGKLGTIITSPESGSEWIRVKWDNGHENSYRIDGAYDLAIAQVAKVAVTKSNAVKGMRVIRGKDWKWGDQDGGDGKLGTITSSPTSDSDWIQVKWDNGHENSYRIAGSFDLYIAP